MERTPLAQPCGQQESAGWDGTVLYSCAEDRGVGALPQLCRTRLVPGRAARAPVLPWEHVSSQRDPTGLAPAILQGKGHPGACPQAGAAPVPVSGLPYCGLLSRPGAAKLGQCGGKSPFLWGLCLLGAESSPRPHGKQSHNVHCVSVTQFPHQPLTVCTWPKCLQVTDLVLLGPIQRGN